MTNRININAPADLQKRIIYFVTEHLNRGFTVRDAVSAAFKKTAESYGEDVELGLNEEAFEKTSLYFQKALDEYRAQKEAGAKAVGNGIFVETVSDAEYHDRTTS